jgi:hypothetical protein
MIRMIKSKWMRWAWHVAQMGAEKKAYRILVGKPEGRSIHGRADNIKMGLRHIKCGAMGWINLTQDRSRGGLL